MKPKFPFAGQEKHTLDKPEYDKAHKSINWFTAVKAQKIADAIVAYWHARGAKNVRAWTVYEPLAGHSVRTNLVRGLPPKDD